MNKGVFLFFRIHSKLRSLFYLSWNRIWFKLIGVKYGKRMQVFDKIYIIGKGDIRIGDDFKFTSGGCVNPICRNIRGALYTVSNESQIIIGNRVGISSACLWAKDRITIGNDVNIGGDTLIMDNDAHPLDHIQRRRTSSVGKPDGLENVIHSAPIEICDDVWIGARCQILKGVHIGARSIIAAGSIVTKDIPSDVIAGGNPCKVLRNN